MKEKLLISLMSISLLTLAGIDNQYFKNANSADESGNCTQDFLSDYNSVSAERRALKPTANLNPETNQAQQAMILDDTCKKFHTIHPREISCKANVGNDMKVLTSRDHKLPCDLLAKAIQSSRVRTNYSAL